MDNGRRVNSTDSRVVGDNVKIKKIGDEGGDRGGGGGGGGSRTIVSTTIKMAERSMADEADVMFDRENNKVINDQFWTDRRSLTAYPAQLFDDVTRGLTRDQRIWFPRDLSRFNGALLSQEQLEQFYSSLIWPSMMTNIKASSRVDDDGDVIPLSSSLPGSTVIASSSSLLQKSSPWLQTRNLLLADLIAAGSNNSSGNSSVNSGSGANDNNNVNNVVPSVKSDAVGGGTSGNHIDGYPDITVILVPLLHCTLLGFSSEDDSSSGASNFAVAQNSAILVRQQMQLQDEAYETLNQRVRLLTKNLESLYDWAMRYREQAVTLIRLCDETDARRLELDRQRYSERTAVLEEEIQRLVRLTDRLDKRYERTLRMYRENFQRELAERKRVIDLLTNYLSGTLFRVGSNPNYIEPRYMTSGSVDVGRSSNSSSSSREAISAVGGSSGNLVVRGSPIHARLDRLLPLYRRLRTTLLERQLLRPLAIALNERIRNNPDYMNNPLIRRYF